MVFYQFLVTAQFGGMVTADTEMEIRYGVVVERIVETEHPVVFHVLVGFLDEGVGLRGIGKSLRVGNHEHLVVEIAFVDVPHINKAEGKQCQNQGRGGDFPVLHAVEVHQHRSDENNDDRAPGIGGKKRMAHPA